MLVKKGSQVEIFSKDTLLGTSAHVLINKSGSEVVICKNKTAAQEIIIKIVIKGNAPDGWESFKGNI
jgi:hypothetical protein